MTRRRPPRTAGPLARLGISAGLNTAKDRAEALVCSRSHLLHCERGAMHPGLDLVDRMAAVYGSTTSRIENAARVCKTMLKRRNAK